MRQKYPFSCPHLDSGRKYSTITETKNVKTAIGDEVVTYYCPEFKDYDTYFINLGVEITANKKNLSCLAEFFEKKKIAVLYNGFDDKEVYYIWIEYIYGRIKDTPDRYIHYFLKLFESIPKDLQKIWKQRKSLCFDIGIQAGCVHPPYPIQPGRVIYPFYPTLAPNTLRKISELNASLTFTVYPYRMHNDPDEIMADILNSTK